MLDKREIILKLRALDLPKDQYCVMTGAALVLHGVKDCTQDIDIGCSEQLYNRLLSQGYMEQQIKRFKGIVIDDCIEIFRNWQADKVVYIDDIPAADIYSVRKYKQELGREKDLMDIELIDEYLAKSK